MMKEVVIDNEEDLQRIQEACNKGGHYQIACISNASLAPGLIRVTILPNSAFQNNDSNDEQSK